MKYGVRLLYVLGATLFGAAACAAGGDDDDAGAAAPPHGGPGSVGGSGSGIGAPGGGSANMAPPEVEEDRAFRVPVVSGHWVWTANPKSGRVALIDATTFTVKTALAGAAPTYLAPLPAPDGGARAIVINSVSHDATLFSASGAGDVETSLTLPVHADANAWSVTGDGRFAIAWTDASTIKNPDPSEGFQDVSVLDLGAKTPSSKRLSVGYRPARVFMNTDNLHAYFVTDAGIDVIDLASKEGAVVAREVPVSADPANDNGPREVEITPDGKRAFVRREGKAFVTVVDLGSGALSQVNLPGNVTDLDLSADASFAVAIVRQYLEPGNDDEEQGVGGQAGGGGAREGGAMAGSGGDGAAQGGVSPGPRVASGSLAVILPVATIAEQPDLFERIALDETFGSVELGAKGDMALLFSNAVANSHLTLLDLSRDGDFKHRTVDLKLPVFAAQASTDGAHAIVLLNTPAGSKQPGAFAVVPVEKNLPPKIQGTAAPTVPSDASKPKAMIATGDTRALVTVSDGANVNYSYLVRMPELTVDPIALDSVPLPQASGLVPDANQAFVAQQHPEGRITFIDLESKEVHTLTGFELSAQVSK